MASRAHLFLNNNLMVSPFLTQTYSYRNKLHKKNRDISPSRILLMEALPGPLRVHPFITQASLSAHPEDYSRVVSLLARKGLQGQAFRAPGSRILGVRVRGWPGGGGLQAGPDLRCFCPRSSPEVRECYPSHSVFYRVCLVT